MRPTAVEFDGITRRFPGVTALDQVSFAIAAGSCHAICGENGAGKSTLSRILAGIMTPDAGEIRIDGTAVKFAEPRDALAAGIAMVHQELVFCENMTVAENLFLGRLPRQHGWFDRRGLQRAARQLLDSIGIDVNPALSVESLTVAQKQLIQIAAAIAGDARIIIFDEPSSSLGEREVEQLYQLIGELRARGVTLVYISHRMPEIFRLCDTITVLRDGRHVATDAVASVDEGEVVQRMIGRALGQYFPAHDEAAAGDVALQVMGFSSPGKFADISFAIRNGEVVGLAGLTGAGRSELAQALFGLDAAATGRVTVRGEPARLRTPRDAMRHRIGLVPEDRKQQGLILAMRSRENITLPVLPRVARWGWIRRRAEDELAAHSASRARANVDALERPALTLSGGNQQKIVLAKWLAAGSTILLLDEPTRGIDVGAKAELHAWIDTLAAQGHAVLLISSELPELLNLSRRILVLREGRLVGELQRADATQDRLVRMMAGLDRAALDSRPHSKGLSA